MNRNGLEISLKQTAHKGIQMKRFDAWNITTLNGEKYTVLRKYAPSKHKKWRRFYIVRDHITEENASDSFAPLDKVSSFDEALGKINKLSNVRYLVMDNSKAGRGELFSSKRQICISSFDSVKDAVAWVKGNAAGKRNLEIEAWDGKAGAYITSYKTNGRPV